MKITKEGYKIIIYTGIILILLVLLRVVCDSQILDIITIIIAVVFCFHFSFFRDPDRQIPEGEHLILSPADGKVIKIDKVKEPLYHEQEVWLVSIFMTLFDVHVNRIPISGEVQFLKYEKGKFLAANLDAAMEKNEQALIGVQTAYGKILFKQVAGLIARRIICRLSKGQRVKRGERFGMIIYSSRVDLFLPLNVELKVSLNDKVKAGSSLIGEYKI
ncbi:MAG: phosphatidylserine decarboxylase family protein [Calditrichaceae bacterium]|nr:phosphatidylserine decarboxylase family protein [Calditrichaceae bacterium]MBN2709383.1 phosphatidylserine decarboxylase family protein [Calditrichaceae bacterium]RQV95756.1 MAG: phosphatidylserine decarboxylase family protein [Calditrichota bacterium]